MIKNSKQKILSKAKSAYGGRNSPRVALFYDWLNQWGGAEKVLLSLIKLYPDAPVYTLVHDPSKTSWLPPQTKVITSFVNKLPFSKNNPVFYTPIYDLALEQFDFSDFDIVISTTSVVGHCLLTSPKTLFVCYVHNINRHLYHPQNKFKILTPLLNIYKKIDHIYSRRPDIIFCNSKTVANRIRSHFQLPAKILPGGIDTNFFVPIKKPSSLYFLLVGRLVAYKNFDIVVKAFTKIPYQLIVVGTGRQENYLKKLTQNSSNIKFAHQVTNSELLNYYQHCQALICPQLEDLGLTPIEAQACGRPVIAYGQGGNTETIINNKTGLFFHHQTVKSLLVALNHFQSMVFDPITCRRQALKFSEKNFMSNFKYNIDHAYRSRP